MKSLALISMCLILGACGSEVESLKVVTGPAGSPGQNGTDGYNSVIDVSRGVFGLCSGLMVNTGLDLDRDGSLSHNEIENTNFVCDGVSGIDGLDGVDGISGTVLETIDPCGDGPGVDEIILRLSDGTHLAWMKNLGLVQLQPNVSYRTTDAQLCQFEITEKFEIIEKIPKVL